MARSRRTKAQLADVDAAIVSAVADEHPATVRGVFYRVVSAGAVEKTENGYRTVQNELLKLRRRGRVPHRWITDGTRWVTQPTMWNSPEAALRVMAATYRRDLWTTQDTDVQIYSEKDAITGVVMPVTDELGVALGIMRGYSSESFTWSVAEEITATLEDTGKDVMIYDLGDHDPSGIDAWRAFQKRLRSFVLDVLNPPEETEWQTYQFDGFEARGRMVPKPPPLSAELEAVLGRIHFERLAVTCDQIVEYGLPTRPTKSSDTRARGWPDGLHPDCGAGSVEVDAIPPTVLREIVRDAVESHIDQRQLEITKAVEASEREGLRMLRLPRSR